MLQLDLTLQINCYQYHDHCSTTDGCPNLRDEEAAWHYWIYKRVVLEVLHYINSVVPCSRLHSFQFLALCSICNTAFVRCVYFAFALLHSLITLWSVRKNSRHFLNQSDAKLKPVTAGYMYLLRALIGSLCCFGLLWLAKVIILVSFGFTTLNWKLKSTQLVQHS